MLRKISLIITLLLAINETFAQNEITISGKVVNKVTKEPLPYVIVALNSNIGAYTEIDGTFKLTFDKKFAKDTINVSFVGFNKQLIPVSKFQKFNILLIELAPNDYNIDNVVVQGKSQSVSTIFKKVNENISKNYISKPYNYFMSLENILTIGSQDTQNQKAKITLYDKNGYFKSDNLSAFKSINYSFDSVVRNYKVKSLNDGFINIDDVLKADIVRNEHNVLEVLNLNDYMFLIEHQIFDGDSVWVIKFTCKNPNIYNTGSPNATSYIGEITINKNDFAIVKVMSQITYNALSPMGFSYYTNPQSSSLSDVKVNYATFYKKINGVYTLNSINYVLSYKENDNQITNIYDLNVKKIETENIKPISGRQFFVLK